jgi:hypothetical protein
VDDGTARIELRRKLGPSMYALVDPDDLPMLSAYTWAAVRGYKDIFYATAETVIDGRRRRVYMHRVILAAPSGACVDHINHDGLDNRRANIRLATTTQNAANMRARGRSAYKGVAWRSDRGYWRAQIKMNGKNTNLGGFATEIEAARAYDAAARVVFGEFACLNFPNEGMEEAA